MSISPDCEPAPLSQASTELKDTLTALGERADELNATAVRRSVDFALDDLVHSLSLGKENARLAIPELEAKLHELENKIERLAALHRKAEKVNAITFRESIELVLTNLLHDTDEDSVQPTVSELEEEWRDLREYHAAIIASPSHPHAITA